MQVSRYTLQSWPTLEGENNPNYFANRTARNEYFISVVPTKGQYTAVGGDPDSSNWSDEVWEVDRFDGENWITVELDKNFALVITNEGILALTNASVGEYQLAISRIAIKQTPIPKGEDVATWTHDSFVNSATYKDVCLDTNNLGNTTFTLARNLTYRTNLLNGGIQFEVELPSDCMGQSMSAQGNSAPTLTEFYVAAIGLYVKDQRTSDDRDVLFAVANLPTRVEKLAGTPERVGNSLKFYLNTTLSNLGNVINLQTVQSSVGSVPEVTTEDSLNDAFDEGVSAPYNLYLVDNYNDTNLPAIAVRKGSPTSAIYPVDWTYFTPTDDTVPVDASSVDQSVKGYMVVAWNGERYVPADSKTNNTQAGLYTVNHIIYAGRVTNTALQYNYSFEWVNNIAINYQVGDLLECTVQGVTFKITVISIEPISGKPIQFQVVPGSGMPRIFVTNQNVTYSADSPNKSGTGLKVNITSNDTKAVAWDFTNWINKPLYVDYDHTNGEPKPGETWEDYCHEAGLDPSIPQDRRGLLTCVENEFTLSHFVGWCINANTIKLALDLRNEATYATYGTTRYATSEEVRKTDVGAKAVTSITPETLKANYFQITVPDTDNTGWGKTFNKPIEVNTYVKFNHPIIGSGMSIPGTALANTTSFYGNSYRALWADLAEYYRADRVYPAGTLITMGKGLQEITIAENECNGIISSKPGYQLGEKNDDYDLPVALVGKVPVLFASDCTPQFGDKIYLSRTEPGKASTTINGKCLGKIIDKDNHLDQKRLIMCVVRIDF